MHVENEGGKKIHFYQSLNSREEKGNNSEPCWFSAVDICVGGVLHASCRNQLGIHTWRRRYDLLRDFGRRKEGGMDNALVHPNGIGGAFDCICTSGKERKTGAASCV